MVSDLCIMLHCVKFLIRSLIIIYTFSLNLTLCNVLDDGFVVGGGETGEMGKLGATDSAHVEIMRIGTFEPSLGGLSLDDLLDAMSCNDIMIPSMASVRPTKVCLNPDSPPELEARFECCASECAAATVDNFISVTNWQLKFLHCQVNFSTPLTIFFLIALLVAAV